MECSFYAVLSFKIQILIYCNLSKINNKNILIDKGSKIIYYKIIMNIMNI